MKVKFSKVLLFIKERFKWQFVAILDIERNILFIDDEQNVSLTN